MSNQDNWYAKYEAVKQHVMTNGHFPNKHTKLCNWVKYQRKRLKMGQMSEEQEKLFLELSELRSFEHTGGRKKKESTDAAFWGELWGNNK